MRYTDVCVESFACTLPDDVVTSAEIEARLAPVYERLGLPEGRLELMTGIRERRFYPNGTRPGAVSARTVRKAIEKTHLTAGQIGALVHGSVCRDQMEPATAAGVHRAAGLPSDCMIMDVSNACLGLLNGMLLIADQIELGRIKAGVVVGTETGRDLVEGTISRLLADSRITRKDIKREFASLTIGSGSAAIVLTHRKISQTQRRLLGGAVLADTSNSELCAGGDQAAAMGAAAPQMQTDSEALLHAGIALAEKTWERFQRTLEWSAADVSKCFTHQVGKAHRQLLLEKLGLSQSIDFPTVEFLGNTGAAALPTAAALGYEQGHIAAGDRVALLGIGSGLSCIMLGIEEAR
ncbi:3-oxoacyl-[acyl-carrier-protein] synthase 3 [Caulifigura coniformis]|uniref:3-oxoacyl-[acyl-carrier-protein] synthase 3 n=1 Tax=Caulifigura coniformis TaxID=2527983 RepID=A0A517SFX9_9PLAN|nr:3-oxoacyl-ACP synthase III [Caulifigura coniformis]QDT55031.1 3-oxoacyl-[acyl-carrier-protein] synthase 3 [Caulifigura coniformis]